VALTIITVIKKDLTVYIRHEKTVVLIFIAPILIMLLIGSVFTGEPDEGLKGITLVVGGGSELGDEIIQELESSNMFIITTTNSTDPAVIEEGIRTGNFSAGIFIPQNNTQALKLYIDNSRVQIAPVISTVFLSITEKMSYELTLGFISTLWEDLAEMDSELEPLKESVIQINSSISDLNSSTEDVMVSLNQINSTGLNISIVEMKKTLTQMKIDLIRTADDISITREELKGLDNNVSLIKDDSELLRDDLKLVIGSIDSADIALIELKDNLQMTYDISCANPSTAQCISLKNTIIQIEDTRYLISERTAHIRSLYSSLSNVAKTSEDLHEKLVKTDIRLQHMQESIGNYTLEISNINDSIVDIETAILILEDVRGGSTNVTSQMGALSSEVSNSSAALIFEIDRTKGVLREVITRSPTTIAAPIKLERQSVFQDKSQLDFLLPGIISIVLMFISFLLASITIVQERSKKTLIRTLLTPLSLEEFIIAKTAALILIAMLQGIIMIFVAFALYHVVVPFSLWDELFLVILIYSASFIGIGMAVATFAESENTAMLTSLVLSIPMLFLCGLFFPFETMPPFMAKLGAALPITMGIRALDSVLIYQQGFEVLIGYLIPLLGYGVVGLGVAYLLLRNEVTG
jgi:ABC-type multidrug transport system permease subunit/predicted  nucleic acid-binding Zn-ribbon protein